MDERSRRAVHVKLKQLLAEVNAHSTTPLNYITASEGLCRLGELWAKFEHIQEALERTAADDAAFEVQITAGEEVETTFKDARGKYRYLVEKLKPKPSTSAAATGGSAHGTTPVPATVRLPVISLPSFDGGYLNWLSFKDLFTAAVVNNPDLTDAQRLQYLKASVTGAALNLIKYLTITDVNYGEAWRILSERYDNKRELVQCQISRLLDLKPVKGENANELQQLCDSYAELIHSLTILGCPTDKWDDLIIVMLTRKLDAETRRDWAKCLTGSSMPTVKELMQFLDLHIRGLNAALWSRTQTTDRRGEKHLRAHHTEVEKSRCAHCQGPHAMTACKEFLAKPTDERSRLVAKHRLCFNCLRDGHRIRDCTSHGTCKQCGKRHHTLLHEDRPEKKTEKIPEVKGNHASVNTTTLLKTAIVHIHDRTGRLQPCRVFLDGGSQGDFITVGCADRLGLKRHQGRVQVTGLGGTKAGVSRGIVKTRLYNRVDTNQELEVELHVMSTITGRLPITNCTNIGLDHLTRWAYTGRSTVAAARRYRHPPWSAWETIFGYVIGGACPVKDVVASHHITVDPINEQLRKFWEMEEPPSQKLLTLDEKKFEQHFTETYKRDSNGRFLVSVPFIKEKQQQLGNSKDIALRRLLQVEKRLAKKPHLASQYTAFMEEYRTVGHMKEVPEQRRGEIMGQTNYLCHHFVTNDSSTTTKLRVVFDWSVTTTSGVSFNDTVLIGATQQDDLYSLLLRCRMYPILIKADITKMFRQFQILQQDTDFHRILWRDAPHQPLREYQLETITYGTAYAPNLATRFLRQLGENCALTYPLASTALTVNSYIDDSLNGVSSPEEGKLLYQQLTQAGKTAGLEFRKWCTNDPEVLAAIPENERECGAIAFQEHETVKTLGIQWCPTTDTFTFKKLQLPTHSNLTKRNLLSEISSLFDPLGFISCVTLRGKLIMQELWKRSISWDEPVPSLLANQWREIREDLEQLPQLALSRCINSMHPVKQELHAFGDSSERGLGATLYLRSICPDELISVKLVTSKFKVTPVKQVTLPRLELCAAVLAAELVDQVKTILKLDAEVFMWSDSTIALTWIRATPRRWNTFVANRVARIQEITPLKTWRHVAGIDNPADLASRGCSISDLLNSSLWWSGPSWLSEPTLPSFSEPGNNGEAPPEERLEVHSAQISPMEEHPLLLRYSSIDRLLTITAWLIRYFLFRANKRKQNPFLTAAEIAIARSFWIRKTQQHWFRREYQALSRGEAVPAKSRLKSFFPFLDNEGLIRVGGRLKNADVDTRMKHPVILTRDSHLTQIFIDHAHQQTLHGGFQLTLSNLQQEFCIVAGRDKVRHVVRKCVRCRRYRAKCSEQLMGDLPKPRVTMSRPFTHTGVDYAGPFSLKNAVGRVPKVYKGYMCLFVCLSTKAIHLEAVSALKTEAFVGVFRRFVGRRGLPTHMYSDRGTNFVGAEKELGEFLRSEELATANNHHITGQGVTWHFNPPAAPHRGGLWEAGVKAAKSHLRHVIGGTPLTYEQFSTLLAQVEGVLNSRPLYPRSPDPLDLEPLTPGHFLTGSHLMVVPEVPALEVPVNRLNQHQRLQQQLQQFWRRWSRDYLNTLQQRNKWMWERDDVRKGAMVLLVEDSSPGIWKMGRVIATHPGQDGHVRAVSVKTATGVLERATTKLIILFNDDD